MFVAETVHDLGQSPPVVATPDISQYPLMVNRAFDRLGWNLDEFRGYRLTMRYPPIPTSAVLRYPLPKAP